MAKIFKKKNYAIGLPRSPGETAEFGRGKKGLIICQCPDCQSVYYKKSWHHNLAEVDIKDVDLKVRFLKDPTCQMLANGQYEGLVIIKNLPDKKSAELTNLINNFNKYLSSHDVLDRVLKVKQNGSDWSIELSENQSALRLGRKIIATFNGQMKTQFKKSPSDLAIVEINFSK